MIRWLKQFFAVRVCPLCHGSGECIAETIAGHREPLRCFVCAGKGRL